MWRTLRLAVRTMSAHVRTQAQAPIHTHIHPHTYTRTRWCQHTRIHTHARTRTRTRTLHTHTHTHTHTNKHTHTHDIYNNRYILTCYEPLKIRFFMLFSMNMLFIWHSFVTYYNSKDHYVLTYLFETVKHIFRLQFPNCYMLYYERPFQIKYKFTTVVDVDNVWY